MLKEMDDGHKTVCGSPNETHISSYIMKTTTKQQNA
jgi:hypothetical protein